MITAIGVPGARGDGLVAVLAGAALAVLVPQAAAAITEAVTSAV
jgi:hypothetical protein